MALWFYYAADDDGVWILITEADDGGNGRELNQLAYHNIHTYILFRTLKQYWYIEVKK